MSNVSPGSIQFRRVAAGNAPTTGLVHAIAMHPLARAWSIPWLGLECSMSWAFWEAQDEAEATRLQSVTCTHAPNVSC